MTKIKAAICVAICLGSICATARAQTAPATSPANNQSLLSNLANGQARKTLENATSPKNLSATLEIMLVLTVLSLTPAILVMTTSFVRIVVVLALLRQALGTQQLPPSQVIIGLSLFLTLLVMAPTWNRINTQAIQPYMNPAPGTTPISPAVAWQRARQPMVDFMWNQIHNTHNDLYLVQFMSFDSLTDQQRQRLRNGKIAKSDISLTALIPAFITSELKQAFIMGFYIYLPFLIIDMVVASVLMSMGMMMLPPILISLPFKLLLFVMVDGWRMVVGSLMQSFVNNPVM